MKILQVVPTYLPAVRHGGAIWAVHGLARELTRRGHRVEVVTTDIHGEGRLQPEEARDREIDGVSVRYCRAGWPRRLAWSRPLARATAEAVRRVDLVHLHSVFLAPTVVAARAAERARVPYLLSPHGMLVADLIRRRGSLRKRAWVALFGRRMLARAAAVVATSELEAVEIRRLGIPCPGLELVPNGVDLFDLSQPVPEPSSPAVAAALDRAPLVLCLGRVSWKKGIDILVAALPLLPKATLAVAGPDEEGEVERLRVLARELGVERRVLFLGHVEGADREALFRRASLLALPSVSENFALVVAESLAASTPVLVSPGVGLADMVERERCGRVTEPEPAAVARAAGEMLVDAAEMERMGRRGRAAVERLFAWEVVGERMEDLYREVLRQSGREAQ